MRPGFALSLSFEGISLLHDTAQGWQSVGDVSPDSSDLGGDLARLRDAADQLDPGNVTCEIVIPNDQIRYLTLETPGVTGDALTEMARAALDGATPYQVDDLVFDLSTDGDQTHIAAVARETLSEAEAFAVDHNFNPVRFVAMPPSDAYSGTPLFGDTLFARTLPDPEPEPVPEPDISEPSDDDTAEQPEAAPPEKEAEETAEATVAQQQIDAAPPEDADQTDDAPTAPPAQGFTSRRRKTIEPEPAFSPPLSGASRSTDIPPAPASLANSLEPTSEPLETPDISTVSVTAPHLDVPVLAEPETTQQDPQAASVSEGLGGFLSRRKRALAPAKPAVQKVVTRPITNVSATATALAPEDETARMTVFGARQPTQIRGKPRFLGLMLTVVLLVFLAAVAAWAALFIDKETARQFFGLPDETELALEPDPPAPEILVSLPDLVEPSEPVMTSPDSELPVDDLPTTSGLTDADSAVLEALRETQETPITPETDALAEAQYAATGIWRQPPEAPTTPPIIRMDDLYVVSIDRTDLAQDAVALPSAPDQSADQIPGAISSPPAAGTSFALDERGLVIPTAEGAVSPDGVVVYLGRPALVPPSTPTRFETKPDLEILRDRLADLRPRQRPDGLIERKERRQLGGLSRVELGSLRPKMRPRTAKQVAEEDETPTAQAVVVSRVPRPRPAGFAKLVRQAKKRPATPEPNQVAAVAPRTVKPKIPSSASVARQATLENAINLRRVNLIGVYGTPSNRRALVRLPSGRYKKVKVGDTVDGGRILAIGDSELRYQKSGRNVTLKIPSG